MINRIFVGDKEISSVNFKDGLVMNLKKKEYSKVWDISSPEFSTEGNWLSSAVSGYEGTPTKYTTEVMASASWSVYAEHTGNYNVYVWLPKGNSAPDSKYTITTADGIWQTSLDQNYLQDSWVKLATVSAVSNTVMKVTLEARAVNTRVNALKIELTYDELDEQYDSSNDIDSTEIAVFINQSGYDADKSKRATITNVNTGVPFSVKKVSDDSSVYEGFVTNNIADFSDYQPTSTEEYYIECEEHRSYDFSIGKYWMQRVSIMPALRFMDESRQDTFDVGGNSGYGWRDSHQFSFEIHSLVAQYMANPSAYDRMPYGISQIETCEYPELRVQNEPDIIWLIKFAATRYYDLKVNHGHSLHSLIKSQLAYFLYIYPYIKDYVSKELYEKVRDMTMEQWSNPECTLQWYEVGDSADNNLFEVQRYIGDTKGQKPPGYAIQPNLLMYEVAKRDGLGSAQQYLDAAYNNCQWLIENVDLDIPLYTKGQRMSEHITMEGLAYFQEMYPDAAPIELQATIERWVDVMISRSDNLWDLRKHSDPDDITNSTLDQWTGGLNQYNETGNVAGFMAAAYAAIRVMPNGERKERLKDIAIAQIDSVFGRNPFNRHHSYDAPSEIEGVDVGWFDYYDGGLGNLQYVTGVLDGSPKESAYPYRPNAPHGYTEGWIAFNTAWNSSLAYLAASDIEVKTFDSSFVSEITTANTGSQIGIRLKAQLNFDENITETGEVVIKDNNGNKSALELKEISKDDYYFQSLYTIPDDVAYIEISYGFGNFKNKKRITVQ